MLPTSPDTNRPPPIARLGASHGYLIDGDQATLSAEILFDVSRLCGQQWALQLWADDLIKIAELPLGLLPSDGNGVLHARGSTHAFPPAGQQAHAFSLRLISDQDGLSDAAGYEQALPFVQPRLGGALCASFSSTELRLSIAEVTNPRPADNLSGTLTLELWVLDTPYSGGAWQGLHLASQILGCLGGQNNWQDCALAVARDALPAGGHLTLMLREWTPAGYMTRDFRTLARPALEPQEAASPAANRTAPIKATTEANASAPDSGKSRQTKTRRKIGPHIAVNSASLTEIASLKGVSQALAQAIVAGRPYASLDELLKVKGIGGKRLESLRDAITL